MKRDRPFETGLIAAVAMASFLPPATCAIADQVPNLVTRPLVTPNRPSILTGLVPNIVAGPPLGAPPDSPDLRIDPNLPSSRFTGVVSIFIDVAPIGDDLGLLCSGTAITSDRIVTAAHCLDGFTDDGVVGFAPGQVTVYVNYDNWSPDSPGLVPPPTFAREASALFMFPTFTGFDSPTINDDVGVILLRQPLPSVVETYPIWPETLDIGDELVMAGYGESGTGHATYTVPSSLERKRVGGNVVGRTESDDEKRAGTELYFWDFDPPLPVFDPFNDGPTLGNTIEAGTGGGDSGGPAFIDDNGQLYLAGVHGFSFKFFASQEAGTFGTGGGGAVLAPYADWVLSVPEPSTVIGGLGLVAISLLSCSRRFRPAAV